MRKTINKAKIAGRVYEHNLEVKVTGPTSKTPGTEYIRGDLNVATDEDCLNVVSVHFSYVTATTKKGQPNNTFAALMKIIKEGKTVVIDGAENATIVKIDTALGVNDFPNREGEMVSAKRNEGGFVTIVNSLSNADDRNKFECDMYINSTRRIEADEEKNIPEDYLVVKGAVFDFRNALIPVEFVCRDKGGMSYFENLDASSSNPTFTKVWGLINSQTIVTRREEASAFGEPAIKEYSRTIREWTITGCNPEPYEIGDAENGITVEDITKAVEDRNVHLAEVKKNAEDYRARATAATPVTTQATAPASVGGFNF